MAYDSPKRKNRQADCFDGLLRNGLQNYLRSYWGRSMSLSLDCQAADPNGLFDFPVVYGACKYFTPKLRLCKHPQQIYLIA